MECELVTCPKCNNDLWKIEKQHGYTFDFICEECEYRFEVISMVDLKSAFLYKAI